MTRQHGSSRLSAYWALGAAAAVAGLIIYWAAQTDTQPTIDDMLAPESAFSVTLADGQRLAGELTRAETNGPTPAVILLHDLGYDRRQWDAYLDGFTSAGWHVVTIDMRGFGESPVPEIISDTEAFFNKLPNDMPEIAAAVRRVDGVDPDRISAVGLGLGANVAMIASETMTELERIVAVSPLDLAGVPVPLAPRATLLLGDETMRPRLESLAAAASPPTEIRIISGAGLGVELLRHAETMPAIVAWLGSEPTQ